MKPSSSSLVHFIRGKVFGFDIGTGSIGWAVRRGNRFLDVGVLVCPEETGDLKSRRALRRQRRTLRSKKYRRQWFARELAALLGLNLIRNGDEELPLPETAWELSGAGGWVPKAGFESLRDPVALRLAAVEGKSLRAEELFTALTHLFRRRGYLADVPWGNGKAEAKDPDAKKEEGEIRERMTELQKEMQAKACELPCQLLAVRAKERALWLAARARAEKENRSPAEVLAELWAAESMRGNPPQDEPRQRREIWPRDLVEKEFRTILQQQAAHFPALAGKKTFLRNGQRRTVSVADWLLYGDTTRIRKNGRAYYVYFKNTESRNPGVFSLKWARFDNRGPALDVLRPLDEQGRPLHVVRKNKKAFINAQWELAVMNFRVVDRTTGELVPPDGAALARLRELWESSQRKRRAKKGSPATPPDASDASAEAPSRVEIKLSLLQQWEKEFAGRYKLVEGQQPLTPQTGAGRARYSSLTLEQIRQQLAQGVRFDPPQPVLRRPGESARRALDRYLADIKHPLVRHRLVLFSCLLDRLVKRYGRPNLIVIEAVRSLALGKENKRELLKRIKENREERESIRHELARRNASTSHSAILRYRLWKEAQSTCPFCGDKITQAQLLNGEADIEHLVPRSVVDCNEFYNLTVGHVRCNRELKGDRTPFQAFGHTEKWAQLRDNAEKCFKGRKLEIFLSPNAEQLIEQKVDLQHTAYIARVLRHVALIRLGWTGADGRDPTILKGNKPSSSFQVTNGQLTSRLRQAWGLNHILHPLPDGKRWEDLTEEEQRQFTEKNRGDLRHHALDAMVIACTLPWLAHRTVGATDPDTGEHGWWKLDERTRRSLALNPVFPAEGQMRRVAEEWMQKVAVRHHVSRSPHQSAYATTMYGKKAPNTYVAREVFPTLTPQNLGDIWPPDLARYCQAAWARYADESGNLEAELKRTKGCVSENFTSRLCFAHFQRWRERVKRGQNVEFTWPAIVKIPIRSVKLISVKDDMAVVRFAPGTAGYVKRTGFKEVRIHLSADGKSYVPVFVPYWRKDQPFSPKPVRPGSRPVLIIRRGMVLETKRPFSNGWGPGKFRVLSTKQSDVQILPDWLANKADALQAAGLPKTGLRPSWSELIRALGYELPHPPSAQPPSAGAVPT